MAEKPASKGAGEKKKRKISAWKKKRACPKCGSGVHLAEHKDRFACGKCGYMEKR